MVGPKPFAAGEMRTNANITNLASIGETPPLASIGETLPAASTTLGACALTPESLLYYCSSRLSTIDEQIDKYFKDQQKSNQATKELSEVQSILSEASFQSAGNDANFDVGTHTYAAQRLLQIYREAKSDEGRKAAADAFSLRSGRDVSEFADPNTSITEKDVLEAKDNIKSQDSAQWAGQIENIKTVSTHLVKNGELNMIQLQSLVSQRQLAVQLTTQLMQAVNESLKNVAGKIGA